MRAPGRLLPSAGGWPRVMLMFHSSECLTRSLSHSANLSAMRSLYDGVPLVVAGGGPAGLCVAAELAFHGIPSIVIEPRVVVDHSRPRAKTTSARTMELFRRWGIAGTVRRAASLPAAWNRRVVFCDTVMGGLITEFDDVFGLDAAERGLAAESGQQIAQPVVEEVLRSHLAATGLVEFRLGHRLEDLAESADSVHCTVIDALGSKYTMRTPYLFGCDGPRSIVRERIGASFDGASAADANLNAVFRSRTLKSPLGDALHYWVLNPRVRGAIGPLDRNGLWWASIGGAGTVEDPVAVKALVESLIGPNPTLPDLEILSIDRWRPRMLISDRFASGRVFLVGESAHVNPPFGGHGFNTCVGDAVNIAWKAAAVIQGWAERDLLGTYEAERRGVAVQTIASAEYNLRASGDALRADPLHIQAVKSAEFYSLGLVLGYAYDEDSRRVDASALDVETYTPSIEPGSRLPHAWLGPDRALFDELGRGMTLVHPAYADTEALTRMTGRMEIAGVPLKLVAAPDTPVFRGAGYLLVRPDQHIAWRGDDLDEMSLSLWCDPSAQKR